MKTTNEKTTILLNEIEKLNNRLNNYFNLEK